MKTLFIATAVAVLVIPGRAHAQDSVAAARDLYASAAYDEALAVLNHLDVSSRPSPDRLEVNQYRAFCLVALRRTAEAEKAIEAVVSEEPLYHPAGADASPRLVSAFTSVRQRVLPGIAQQKYAEAKAAFDRKEFDVAVAAFDEVLKVLSDPDLSDAGSRPPLADMRTLAAGFRDLSVRASAPPPPAVAVIAPAPPPLPAAVPARIYVANDADVLAPSIVRQELPPFPHNFVAAGVGLLEVVINEAGQVESATMRAQINPHYDAMVISATRSWKFKPATVAGTPVKFRKLISISVKPT